MNQPTFIPMTTLQSIEEQTADYARKRAKLAELVEAIEILRRNALRDNLARLKTRIAELAESRETLQAMLESQPGLFERPRTRTFHGIKVGFTKGRGKVEIPNEDYTVKRIKELYQDDLGVLIQTTEKPIKTALEKLPAAELKKLGVHIADADDQVVIKAADSEIDKLIAALMDDEELQEIKDAAG